MALEREVIGNNILVDLMVLEIVEGGEDVGRVGF